jgi:hypothetical protein
LFFESIIVVTIGTSCCSDGFFYSKYVPLTTKKRQPSMDYLSSQEKFLWRRKTMTIFSLIARGETSKH